MKKVMLLAGTMMLAACGANDDATDADMNEMVTEDTTEVSDADRTAPDGETVVGSYSMRDPDGNERGTLTINSDWSYSRTMGDETETGTFSFNDEDWPCFDAADDDAGPICYPGGDGSVNDDGSWTSYDSDGNETGTIIRIQDSAESIETATADGDGEQAVASPGQGSPGREDTLSTD
ncbi:hypothetical protein [Sphingomicrobium sediminis]|uniref:Lipoprotein n=1 Tax=Sphingomicrobium sediminis TaxID=2950949 RepID=A0A9X2EKH8_9SPHN|nr:hypothetical protein [Sphingomicrobium sediminis]MCM8557299.1 hypothetical protein [Sphingomicrobium sediminis]